MLKHPEQKNRAIAPIAFPDRTRLASGSVADTRAVAYRELRVRDGLTQFSMGIDTNIVSASLKAINRGVQRAAARVAIRLNRSALA